MSSHEAPPLPARLFMGLEAAGLRWALLRPPEFLAEPEGDIDVLVHPGDLQRARAVVRDHGFVSVPMRGEDVHAATYDEATGRFERVHLQTQITIGGRVTPADPILRSAVRDPLPRASDAWLFWIVLLHAVQDKPAIPSRHQRALRRLLAEMAPGAAPPAGLSASPGLTVELVRDHIERGDWAGVRQLPALARPPARLRLRAAAVAARVRALLRGRGLAIALPGASSPLLDELARALPAPARVVAAGAREPRVGLAQRCLLAYHLARGRIVLSDRPFGLPRADLTVKVDPTQPPPVVRREAEALIWRHYARRQGVDPAEDTG